MTDERRLSEVDQTLQDITPRAEALAEAHEVSLTEFNEADAIFQQWQSDWENLNTEAAEPEKERGVQTTLVDNHRANIQSATDRQQRSQAILSEIESNIDVEQIDEKKAAAEEAQGQALMVEEQLAAMDETVTETRADIDRMRDSYNNVRNRLQGDRSRLQSLQEIREHLLGDDDNALQAWKSTHGLDSAARLLEGVQVDKGWELSVETLMAEKLTAIAVDDLSKLEISELSGFSVSVFTEGDSTPSADKGKFPRLLDKLESKINLSPWLQSVYAAEDIAEAMSWRNNLDANELIVTRQGELVGTHWLSVGSSAQGDRGVLAQEAEIESLTKSVAESEAEVEKLKQRGESKKAELEFAA